MPPNNVRPQPNLLEILDHVDYGMNLVDTDFNIQFTNEESRAKFNLQGDGLPALKCHELLFNNAEPCSNCPVRQMELTGEKFGQIVGALNTKGNPNHRVKYHRMPNGMYVQTLNDVTRETELVRQVSLQSKETQAQNIILKRKRQELERHGQFMDSVFDAVHSGIVVIDSNDNLSVTSSNQAIARFLGKSNADELNRKKCYQLFGFQRRCPGCPIEKITSQTPFHRLRYNQKVGEYNLTEFYSPLPDGKLLLIFEDSTKRISLLQQLKEHKEIIERQNQIFRSLLETSTMIQQTNELDELFNCTLNQLIELFNSLMFGMILDGERPEILECVVFRGVNDIEQRVIMENHTQLLDPNIAEVLIQTIHRSHTEMDGELDPPENYSWLVLPMLGRDRRLLGKMLIKGQAIDQQAIDIISLFLEQVSAVSENKLLTRQLEKMANTDALTGAYNRAYFERELEKSIDNSSRFSNIVFTIFMIDVNGLKRVNDVFGHEAGDNMIIIVSKLLNQVCRKSDVVTRVGGDEFVVLCPATNLEKAQILLKRIRDQEAETQMTCKHNDGAEEVVQIRMSIGIASSEEDNPEVVMKLADKRMYEDKEAFYQKNKRYR